MITEVWIPVRRYKLTLKHKLLNELGEISHFILNALHQMPLTLADFESITGLSDQQLRPVIKRLEGLQFIDLQGQLTTSGQYIAYIIENLHQKTVLFWLDRRYESEKKAILLIKGDSNMINQLPKNAVKIDPKQKERDWETECFSQTIRLQKSIHDVLPRLLPAFELMPNFEAIKWGQEWELDLRVDAAFADGYGLPVQLELTSQRINEPAISLFTKVLALETNFDLPKGIEFGRHHQCPIPLKFQYSFVEEAFYENLPYINNADPEMTLVCPSDPVDDDIAKEMLRLCQENSSENDFMFNKQHTFYVGWQQHDASWTQICECIENDGTIYESYT